MNRNIKKVLKVFCMFISHDQQVLTTKKLQNYIELIEVPIFQLRKVCFKKKKKVLFYDGLNHWCWINRFFFLILAYGLNLYIKIQLVYQC